MAVDRNDRPCAPALASILARTLASGLALAAVCGVVLRLTAGLPGESLAERALVVSLLAAAGGAAYALSMTVLGGEQRQAVGER